ncbi:MLEC (predicted) [Pycnogonum litorale]
MAKLFLMFLIIVTPCKCGKVDVIYAVNCGGDNHIDSHGVHYLADPNEDGIASDHGKSLVIDRAPEADQLLYQTERYSLNTFGYEIPHKFEDGHYVFILKFCEVYFRESNRKVFDIMINDQKVISELDIFDIVGHGVAHEEYVEFTVDKGNVLVNGQKTRSSPGKLLLEFVKLNQDNPKINAFVLFKGKLSDVPKLPPPSKLYEDDDEEEIIKPPTEKKQKTPVPRRPSGPKTPNPYESDDSSSMLPIFIAIAAFIPLVFCLCKL